MRLLLFLLLAGCSAPFTAALERSDSGAPDAPGWEGGPPQDGGGEGDALADGAEAQVPEAAACMPEAGAENQECNAHSPGGLQPFVYAVYCGPSGAPGCPTPDCQPPAPTPVECLCDYTCACIMAHCTGYCCQMANATCAKGSLDGVLVTCNP